MLSPDRHVAAFDLENTLIASNVVESYSFLATRRLNVPERVRYVLRTLAAALAFKNDLTSMLTHDVAQPISSIASLAELLCADWHDLPEDIRLELATKIDKNTRRLIKMMNDLQLLFRLDTGTVTARLPVTAVTAAFAFAVLPETTLAAIATALVAR